MLTDADIDEIVDRLHKRQTHVCRFGNIPPEDMVQVVKFNKNFEKMINKTGSIIWATVIVAIVGGAISMLFIGFVSKITGKGI